MNTLKVAVILLVCGGVIAGYYFYQQTRIVKNTVAMTERYADQLKHDTFLLRGEYRWTFFLGPVEQISIHTFAPKFIDYRMRGKVHSTDYRMMPLSYDDSLKKWIGQTPEGIVYVLFFKEISDDTVTLYKHKCKKGLSEAIDMQRPVDAITADHGWNVYTRAGVAERNDELPFGGIFYKGDNPAFTLHDDKATWQNQTYDKLTHHFGERRWVGHHKEHYLVIFYDDVDMGGARQGRFSVQVVNDVETAYKLKHGEQTFTTYQVK